VVINLSKGFLASLFDKELQKELIDLNDQYGFGQLIYAKGGEGTRLVGNQKDLLEGQTHILQDFTLLEYEVQTFSYGTSVKMTGNVPRGSLEVEWKLLNNVKRIDLSFRYDKEVCLEKEAVYVAFPMNLHQASSISDSQLGWVNWDRDQLPGGCKEWLPLQTGIFCDGKDADVYIASPDIPLFCIGDMIKGNWPKDLALTGSRIFSYVLNNYWNTNYKASQGGKISFRYSFTSNSEIKKEDAYRFGWEIRQPLYGHRISFQDFREPKVPYLQKSQSHLAKIDCEQVAITTIKKAKWEKGWILRLQEIAGENQTAKIEIPYKSIREAWEVDLLEKEVQQLAVNSDGTVYVNVPAWRLITVRIDL
jgi:hypothetical protein